MKLKSIFVIKIILLLLMISTPPAQTPYRIVVLPFYAEQADQINDSLLNNRDYRRVRGLINNHLVRSGFDVVNADAANLSQKDYDTLAKRFRSDSQASVVDVNRRYSTDAVYIIWLDAKIIHGTGNDIGFCKVELQVDGEGYSSDNSSLGATIAERFVEGGGDCKNALIDAEKQVADTVGEFIAGASPARSSLRKQLDNQQSLITVRLDGISKYESIEVMGKVLNTVIGVLSAKRLGGNLSPNNAQAGYEVWRLSYDNNQTEAFRIQANIMSMIKEIIHSNGELTLKGVPYRYTPGEISLLKGVRPGRSTSKAIQFIFDIGRKSRSGFE